MARPKKQTVDYFPHQCSHGKTMFILEQKYGNDGYAFWFKLLELLGCTEGHCLKLENPADWEFLTAKTRLSGETCEEILNLLVKLEAIDAEAWEKRIVWCDNFIDNIKEAYRNRTVEIPKKPDCLRKKPYKQEDKQRQKSADEMKEDEMKEDEMKEDEMKEEEGKTSRTPHQDIVNLYNKTCISLPKVRDITKGRQQAMRLRWVKYKCLDTFEELFQKAEKSSFLSGKNGKWNGCNFDWLIKEANMVKVLEGNYDDKEAQNGKDKQHTEKPKDMAGKFRKFVSN